MGNRVGYQVLGFAVWTGAKWYLKRRYGPWPRRLALAALMAVGIGAFGAAAARDAD